MECHRASNYFVHSYLDTQSVLTSTRICLGQQFALTKAAYVTVRLLQRFDKLDGSSVPPGPIKWAVTLTGKPKDGVRLRLHVAAED
jgi:cytochrome P450